MRVLPSGTATDKMKRNCCDNCGSSFLRLFLIFNELDEFLVVHLFVGQVFAVVEQRDVLSELRSSFDAAKVRNCPFFGNDYPLEENEWIVTDIRL